MTGQHHRARGERNVPATVCTTPVVPILTTSAALDTIETIPALVYDADTLSVLSHSYPVDSAPYTRITESGYPQYRAAAPHGLPPWRHATVPNGGATPVWSQDPVIGAKTVDRREMPDPLDSGSAVWPGRDMHTDTPTIRGREVLQWATALEEQPVMPPPPPTTTWAFVASSGESLRYVACVETDRVALERVGGRLEGTGAPERRPQRGPNYVRLLALLVFGVVAFPRSLSINSGVGG